MAQVRTKLLEIFILTICIERLKSSYFNLSYQKILKCILLHKSVFRPYHKNEIYYYLTFVLKIRGKES